MHDFIRTKKQLEEEALLIDAFLRTELETSPRRFTGAWRRNRGKRKYHSHISCPDWCNVGRC